MIERVENRGLEEPLELEGTEDEFSKCRKSKIKYTRALLLELTEVEVCRKLPSDFDLQLDGGSEATVEQKSIIGKPFHHGPVLTTTWNLPFPDQGRDSHLYTRSTESCLQRNCSSERKEVNQPLAHKPEEDAGILHCPIQKCDLFQLSKAENPYRPPHLNRRAQPLATLSESGVESPASRKSDRKGSADDNAGHEQSGHGLVLAGADDSNKEPVLSEAFWSNNEGTEVIEPSKSLDDYEYFWRQNEGNVVIGAKNIRVASMGDNEPTFDDFWAEILETIHLQQEPSISRRNSHADSDIEIHFPDEESLTSVGPDNLNFDEKNGAEAEISLPDEDSLIHDMIAPYRNSGSWQADKVTSNIAVDIINHSNSGKVANRDDRPKRLHHKAQRHPSFTGLLPHSQTSMDIFSDHLSCDQAGFRPLFSTPDVISYIPILNGFAQSDIPPTPQHKKQSHFPVFTVTPTKYFPTATKPSTA